MEHAVAHLGGPAPDSNIADTLSSLADTLQLSSGATAAVNQPAAPPTSETSTVDVSGVLQSLRAAVPALGGTSGTQSVSHATHTLSAEARAPSGGLSGLGSQLLQLQQHMKDSQSSDPNSSASRHRSTAAAIAAALHDATPQDDVHAPAAPDFTLLSETVSESLHHQSHTQEPSRRESPPKAPAPPPTPPVPKPAVPSTMKPRPPAPAAPPPPPGAHNNQAQMPPPQPPAIHRPRPQLHPPGGLPPPSETAMSTAGPPVLSGGAFMRGPRSHPAAPRMPPTNGAPRRHAASEQDAAPLATKPSSWTAPQAPRPAALQQHSRPPQPPPSRPGPRPGERPAAQRTITTAGDQSGQPSATSRPGSLTNSSQKPATVDRPSTLNGGPKTAASQKSVVHPNNPLKRIPVSAAQAIKPAVKDTAADSAAQGPSPMQRLAAAMATLERKPVPQAPAGVPQQAARGKPDVKIEDLRAMVRGGPTHRGGVRGGVGPSVKREVSSGSAPSVAPPAPENRHIARAMSDSNGSVVQLSQVKSKPVERPAAIRTGEKRQHQPAAMSAGERQGVKKMRPPDIGPDMRARATAVDRGRESKGASGDGAIRQAVRPGGQLARQGIHAGKHGFKAPSGESEALVEQGRDRIAERLHPMAKPAVRSALASRAVPRKPPARPADPHVMDDSSDDDMVLVQRAPARPVPPQPRTRDGGGDVQRQGAAAGGAGKRRRGAVSPQRPRAVSLSPHRRQPQPPAQLITPAVTDVAQRPGKRSRSDRHAMQSAEAPDAAPARRIASGRTLSGGGHAASRSALAHDATDGFEHGNVVLALGAARPAVVTHDVEAQTEPPDVRDSSVQTAQIWGRSTACQADRAVAESDPVRQQCHTKSTSVQCDIAAAAGSAPRGGGGEFDGECDAVTVVRMATEALHAANEILAPAQRLKFAFHQAAILEILSGLASQGGAAVVDGAGWEMPGDDQAEFAEHEDPVVGSAMTSDGPEELEWHNERWYQDGVPPHGPDKSTHAETPPVSAAGSDLETGGHSQPGTPKIDAQAPFDDVAVSPDEVPLEVAPSREESPDEAPVASVQVQARAGEESDDEVPLMQAVPAGSGQAPQEEEEEPEAVGAAEARVDEGGPGEALELEEEAVVQAAIMSRLRKLLPKADLNVATAKSVRGRLEFSLRRDLKAHMTFIKEAISHFLEDPAAFAVEHEKEAALAALFVPAVPHRSGAVQRGLGAAAGQHHGAGGAGPREPGSREVHVAGTRLRDGAGAAEKRSSPAPDLVGRLNGAIAPKRKGGGALYCLANKSAKERFQTSMTPEQLREAKEAARAGLD